MKESIVLIGGGGHCRSCIDVIESGGVYQIIGVIDIALKVGQKIFDYKIIGCDEDMPEVVKKYKNVLVTIGQINSPEVRIRLFESAQKAGAYFPAIFSPHAYISKYSTIDEGSIVMHNCVINTGASIGKNCIINTSALIEHDTVIGDNCHISTACVINGSCTIGNNVFLGSNVTVSNNVKISGNIGIGAGSVINKDLTESGMYAGIPAKKIKDFA